MFLARTDGIVLELYVDSEDQYNLEEEQSRYPRSASAFKDSSFSSVNFLGMVHGAGHLFSAIG